MSCCDTFARTLKHTCNVDETVETSIVGVVTSAVPPEVPKETATSFVVLCS